MCRVQDEGAPGVDGLGLSAVDDLGGERSEAGVAVVVVVGGEDLRRLTPSVNRTLGRPGFLE